MVGDRYLTDVAFGNRLGMLTVRVDPVDDSGKGEPRAVRASRAVEEALVRRRKGKGKEAPRQVLVEREVEGRRRSRGSGSRSTSEEEEEAKEAAFLRGEVLRSFVRK